jgi:membrane protease YdiL (CAAX protease family)
MNETSQNHRKEEGPRWSPVLGCGISLGVFILWGTLAIGFDYLAMLAARDNSPFQLGAAIPAVVLNAVFVLVTLRLLGFPAFKTSGLLANIWSLPEMIGGTAAGALAIAFYAALLRFLRMSDLQLGPPGQIHYGQAIAPVSIALAFVMIAIYAASEEVIMRGLIYPLLRRSVGLIAAMILTSLTFSLMHVFNPSFGYIPSLSVFLSGILLCLMRELTGNLYLAIGVHFGWNMAQVIAGLPLSGYQLFYDPQSWHVAVNGPGYLTGGDFGPEGSLTGVLALIIMIVISVGLLVYMKFRDETVGKGSPVFQ